MLCLVAPAFGAVTVPYHMQRGHVMVPATATNSQPLSLMLDTGYGINMIHPEYAEKLGLRRIGKMTIVGIAGEEEADTYQGLVLNFGSLNYAPRRVAALASESNRSRRRDGVLGSGFFRRFVVELDPVKSTITLHDPSGFEYSGNGTVVPLSFRRDTPIIDGVIGLSATQMVSSRFEVDTGCDGGLCLGQGFVEAHGLLEKAQSNQQSVRSGVGGRARTVEGKLPFMELGGLRVANPQAQFFTQGSPADRDMAGHVGWDVLRQFRVIFDYSRRQLILEKL
jgi:hypothetical protein